MSARVWWATLPYAYPLAWVNRIAEKIPGFEAFEPRPEVTCTCDYCRGVPGAVFEP